MPKKKKVVTKVNYISRGFLSPQIKPEEYTFGGRQMRAVPINDSKDWTDFLPTKEIQFNSNFDSNGCFIYGSLNQVETLLKFLTKKDYNYSERFNAFYSDWTQFGGNPHNVLQSLRHDGAIGEAKLPFNESITRESYIVPKMPKDLVKEGLQWLEEWDLKHEWLFTPKDTNKALLIDQALGFCPVAVSVTAWKERDGIYVKDKNEVDNHYCLLYKMNADGTYMVFDTYDNTRKKLAKNYDFQYAKRITLRKKEHHPNWFIDFIGNLFKWLK